ncbi:hypothetical protein [Shewanella denitrificans]|jgi:hypothetical protein
MSIKQVRDIEKNYSSTEFVAKLRRLADAIETGRRTNLHACPCQL